MTAPVLPSLRRSACSPWCAATRRNDTRLQRPTATAFVSSSELSCRSDETLAVSPPRADRLGTIAAAAAGAAAAVATDLQWRHLRHRDRCRLLLAHRIERHSPASIQAGLGPCPPLGAPNPRQTFVPRCRKLSLLRKQGCWRDGKQRVLPQKSFRRRLCGVPKCSKLSGASWRRGFGIDIVRRGWHPFCVRDGSGACEGRGLVIAAAF